MNLLGNAAGPIPFGEALSWVVAVGFGLVAIQFVLGPVLIYHSQKSKRSPTLLTFDPDKRPAPPVVQDFLTDVEAALWGCGFEALAHVAMPDVLPNVKAIFTLFARPASDDSAMAVCAFAVTTGTAALRQSYVEFMTEYADGSIVLTNNCAIESAFRRMPHKRVLQFDMVPDAANLWRVHERASEEFRTGAKRPAPTEAEALDRLRAGMLKERTDQVEIGWLWFDESADAFRPTWKGACLMTWKMAWPVSAYRLAARRRRAWKLLREWDLVDAARRDRPGRDA